MPSTNTIDALTLAGNQFVFFNPCCKCKCDTITTDDFDHTTTILRLKRSLTDKVLFAFKASDGLVTIDPSTGTVKDNNILSELLDIKDNDIEALETFFEKYGFFFYISQDKMESYDTEIIFNLHKRLKYLVELMSLIQEPEPDYRRIFSLICWLIFSNRIHIETVERKQPIYSSCLHPLTAYLEENNRYRLPDQTDEMDDSLDLIFGEDYPASNNTPDYSNDDFIRNDTVDCDDDTDVYYDHSNDYIEPYNYTDNNDEFEDNDYEDGILRYLEGEISPEKFSHFITDYIYPPGLTEGEIEMQFIELEQLYSDDSGPYPLISHRKLESLYLDNNILSFRDRYIIQYFSHTEYTLGRITFLNNDGCAYFLSNDDDVQFYEHLDENLKKATLQVAKYIIKEELDYNLSAITPSYDIRQMAPAWRIPDLFSALYFSLFYMNSSQELFRLCANPSCRKPFRVETTRRNKKYCCDACRNAVGQRNYRNKKAKKH